MARIAHLIRSIRRTTPNVLVVDAGDIFQGTPLFTLYKGAVEVELLNRINYDIFTIGNHEFDMGAQNLAAQLKKARFSIISSNLDASALPELAALFKPSVVKTVDGQKVGFVGAITPDISSLTTHPDGIKVIKSGPGAADIRWREVSGQNHGDQKNDRKWIAPIRKEVKDLCQKGINKVILVTHCGLELDRQLAEQIPDVDAIIGGHSHTRLSKPVVIERPGGQPCLIVQAGSYGRDLGKLVLCFDPEGRIKDSKYGLIRIKPAIPEEEDIKAYLSEQVKPLAPLRNKVAGIAEGDFEKRFWRYPWDSPLGDLICDALADAGTDYGVTIAFHNRGGVRSRIDRGMITLEKIQEVLPFDNFLVFASVKGSAIKKALEHSVSGHLGARFVDVHGLKFAYDRTKPAGRKITFVLARNPKGDWEELSPEKTYKIAINNFNFNGGEGYDFSGATDIKSTDERLSEVLADYLYKMKRVSPNKPNRIVPVSGGLLALKKTGEALTLELTGCPPNSPLTLVMGDGPGVSTVAGPLPVPLMNAKVYRTGSRSDQTGSFKWRLRSAPAKKWFSVIVHPSKRKGAYKTLISKPVSAAVSSKVPPPVHQPLEATPGYSVLPGK